MIVLRNKNIFRYSATILAFRFKISCRKKFKNREIKKHGYLLQTRDNMLNIDGAQTANKLLKCFLFF